MNCPAFEPLPVTTLKTPGGRMPLMRRASSSTESGVRLDGLNTVQQPAASTGASFQAAMRKGKFHGTICPTTPIGSRRIIDMVFSSSMAALPSSVRTAPAK